MLQRMCIHRSFFWKFYHTDQAATKKGRASEAGAGGRAVVAGGGEVVWWWWWWCFQLVVMVELVVHAWLSDVSSNPRIVLQRRLPCKLGLVCKPLKFSGSCVAWVDCTWEWLL